MRTIALLLIFSSACTCRKDEARTPPERLEDDVRPAFDGAPRQLDPQAVKLCEALHQLPAERRASCCKRSTLPHFGGECARVVSLALESRSIALVGVEACTAALERAYQGCEWVGPNDVSVPPECADVIVGALSRATPCRSTLECQPGLRCRGAGPTARGVCDAPGVTGTACELSVDVLLSYTRSPARPHLECAGACQRHRCEDVITDGGVCTLDAQCPAGQRCAGTCVVGALGGSGAACVPGGCAEGLRCVAGRCAERLPSGASCQSDVECRGACLTTDAARACGPGC